MALFVSRASLSAAWEKLEKGTPWKLGALMGLLAFLVRLPFSIRYDLNMGGDWGGVYLMAVRVLKGVTPLYGYGQDYHGTLETYATAGLFAVFGPSLILAGVVILAEWSAAIAIAVTLMAREFGGIKALWGGVFVVVGVPFTVHYTAVPSIAYTPAILMPLVIFLLLHRAFNGPRTIPNFLLAAFFMGLCVYWTKLAAPGILAALLAWAFQWRSQVGKGKAWAVGLLLSPAAAFLGYLPEFLYFRTHAHMDPRTHTATLEQAHGNLPIVKDAWLNFFNAQPVSRIPEGPLFFTFNALDLNQHPIWVDYFGMFVAEVFVLFFAWTLFQWLRRKSTGPVTLFFVFIILINVLLVIFSGVTQGSYYNARRYLLPSAVATSAFIGIFFHQLYAWAKPRILPRVGAALFAAVFLGSCLWTHVQLLRAPDQMVEVRQAAREMAGAKVEAGIGPYGYSMLLGAVMDGTLRFGTLDYDRIPDDTRFAYSVKHLGYIDEKGRPFKEWEGFGGHSWRLQKVHPLGTYLHWAEYVRVAHRAL